MQTFKKLPTTSPSIAKEDRLRITLASLSAAATAVSLRSA
jgi:hypothetical protein